MHMKVMIIPNDCVLKNLSLNICVIIVFINVNKNQVVKSFN